jgi:tRNA (guanine6-N2)-methyltransferase
MIELCRESFEQLDDLYKLAKNVDYGWFINANQTFAVRSERVGVHDFTSIDVSRVVGQAVIDAFLEAHGKRLKVNLDNPDVEIYALVRNDEFLLGVNTTGKSLHRRGYRVYEHPAALKPTLASAMLEISGWKPEKSIIDPMCGGATIPIETAFKARNMAPNRLRKDFAFLKLKMFDKKEFEKIRMKALSSEKRGVFEIYGMEKFSRHLNGAFKNSEKAGVCETIKFRLGDATKAKDYPKENLEFVVVNPPYGVRMVPGGSPKKLYDGFLKALRETANGAILVLITAAYRRFEEATDENDIAILEERRVLHGELKAKIFKCKI